jgi:hypothetical protein
MPDPRNQFYGAMGGLGGKPGGTAVPTPPMRLPQDMAGPAPPRGPMPMGMPNMSEADAIKSEQGYYGPPTPQMLRGGRLPDVDLMSPGPGQSDPGAMEERMRSVRRPPGTEGKAFIDRVEEGFAVIELPNSEETLTLPAQKGWAEGMFIDVPKRKARPTGRRPVP